MKDVKQFIGLGAAAVVLQLGIYAAVIYFGIRIAKCAWQAS